MKITIPKPCSQRWEDLTLKDQGRFCSTCQQIIVDFTQMSDQEIVEYLKVHTTGKVCGKITVFPAVKAIAVSKKSKRSLRVY
jgi:predicted house-cleaning NTP pyrophosphatase (Maf/HAM1 superfamily)